MVDLVSSPSSPGQPELVRRVRSGWAILLALYTWHILRTPDAWHLPDFINLPIHESGHLVFGWGGEVITVLGGTLLELIFPLLFVGYFVRQRDATGAGTALWWTGQNGFYIATYLSDARAQELPLVGGGEHDWAFLLDHWGVLEHDLIIGQRVRAVAMLVMIAGVVWAWRGRTASRTRLIVDS